MMRLICLTLFCSLQAKAAPPSSYTSARHICTIQVGDGAPAINSVFQGRKIEQIGLLDTGAIVNVYALKRNQIEALVGDTGIRLILTQSRGSFGATWPCVAIEIGAWVKKEAAQRRFRLGLEVVSRGIGNALGMVSLDYTNPQGERIWILCEPGPQLLKELKCGRSLL